MSRRPRADGKIAPGGQGGPNSAYNKGGNTMASGRAMEIAGGFSARHGVTLQSDSGRDPDFYKQKLAPQARLGRELTTAEFQRDHYVNRQEGGGLSESGTSVFDATLCEAAYTWFCPPGGVILDPFAGGSVRGVVASRLGRQYVGIDLSERQIAANREQAADICEDPQPVWHVGDSRGIASLAAGVEADLVFSCPPYADLEVYSDDPRDISGMDYDDFLAAYREIIRAAVGMLRPDRFACFVVGEARGADGYYYGLVPDTIRAFEDAGARFYNEAILVTVLGSLPVRVARQFEGGRKFGKTHQNVLVFCKGDWKRATEACGPIEVYTPDEAPDAP